MSSRSVSGFLLELRRRDRVASCVFLLIGLVAPWPTMYGSAQDAVSVWSGVYTTAQAERGRVVYAAQCGRCHGDDLSGNRAYPLVGERFMDHWDAHTVQ